MSLLELELRWAMSHLAVNFKFAKKYVGFRHSFYCKLFSRVAAFRLNKLMLKIKIGNAFK